MPYIKVGLKTGDIITQTALDRYEEGINQSQISADAAKEYADSLAAKPILVDGTTVTGDGRQVALRSPRQGLRVDGPYATVEDIPTPYSDTFEYLVGAASPYAIYILSNGSLVEIGSSDPDLHNYYTKDDVDAMDAQNVKLSTVQTITGTKTFSVVRSTNIPTDNNSLTNKQYVDNQDLTTLNTAVSTSDGKIEEVRNEARMYSDSVLESANSYSDTGDTTVLAESKLYSDQRDDYILDEAKAYTDSKSPTDSTTESLRYFDDAPNDRNVYGRISTSNRWILVKSPTFTDKASTDIYKPNYSFDNIPIKFSDNISQYGEKLLTHGVFDLFNRGERYTYLFDGDWTRTQYAWDYSPLGDATNGVTAGEGAENTFNANYIEGYGSVDIHSAGYFDTTDGLYKGIVRHHYPSPIGGTSWRDRTFSATINASTTGQQGAVPTVGMNSDVNHTIAAFPNEVSNVSYINVAYCHGRDSNYTEKALLVNLSSSINYNESMYPCAVSEDGQLMLVVYANETGSQYGYYKSTNSGTDFENVYYSQSLNTARHRTAKISKDLSTIVIAGSSTVETTGCVIEINDVASSTRTVLTTGNFVQTVPNGEISIAMADDASIIWVAFMESTGKLAIYKIENKETITKIPDHVDVRLSVNSLRPAICTNYTGRSLFYLSTEYIGNQSFAMITEYVGNQWVFHNTEQTTGSDTFNFGDSYIACNRTGERIMALSKDDSRSEVYMFGREYVYS